MNKREVFDKVKTHLLSQMLRSVDTAGRMCAYRGAGGLKCAVGCLIPDDLYTPKIEGGGPFSPKLDLILDKLGLGDVEMKSFLSELQRIHDNFAAEDWAACLDELEEKEFAS